MANTASKKPRSDEEKVNGREQVALSVEELLAQPELEVLEIPELSTPTKNHVVHLLPLTAGAVIDLVLDSENRPTGESLCRLISQSLAHPDGRLMFDERSIARLREMRLDVFNRVSGAVMKKMTPPASEDIAGKAESSGDGSSTDSPSN